MRFKVSMINELGNCQEEAVLAKNEIEAKQELIIFNPMAKVLEAKLIYK